MKGVLEYTEEELRAMPSSKLKILAENAAAMESLFNTEQMTLKIMINALYGAMGNRFFPLFNEAMAAAITGNGRYFIKMFARKVEARLQGILRSDKPYVIGGDTDSCFIQIEEFVQAYMERNPGLPIDHYVDWSNEFEKKVINPVLLETIEEFATQLNAYNKEKIGADREVIADAAVITGKKRYFMRVRDKEGTRYPEDKPFIKKTGINLVQGSTPKWSKKYLEEAIPIILDKNDEDLRNWLNSIKQGFVEADLNSIATSGGISKLDGHLGQKGLHFGQRSALVHNKYIKENGLEGTYASIKAGDKCKRLHLLKPNKFDSDLIAYTNDQFIKELEGIIDYDKNFESGFLSSLELMTKPMNWDLRKETQSLEDW